MVVLGVSVHCGIGRPGGAVRRIAPESRTADLNRRPLSELGSGPIHTGHEATRRNGQTQMEPLVGNGSIHTGRKQHQS